MANNSAIAVGRMPPGIAVTGPHPPVAGALLAAMPQLPLEGVHWVIVGGESGPRRRPITPDWVRGIRDQCRSRRVPFFFKQWGGFNSKSGGCLLDGRKWQEWPESTQAQLLESMAC